MDYNPPSAADYAWSSANDAKRAAESNEKRIAALEREVARLAKLVDKLNQKKGW